VGAAHAHESALLDAGLRLACAARRSTDAVREEIVRAARAIAPDVDGVLVYERDADALRCSFTSGERFAYYAGSSVALDDAAALPARALAAGHHLTLAAAGTRRLHASDVAAVGAPVVHDAERACVLVAAARLPLDRGAVERLVVLANQAAPAYLIALDREHDRRRAEYDGLTGLLTPRAFRQRLTGLIDRARLLPAAQMALVFVDTDRFKRWNDTYGHAAGDALLRELATVLRAVAAERDLVARNGGDEFCIVFAETGKASAIERAEALRSRVAALDAAALLATPPAQRVAITASIGVAAYPADATSASALLERADAAMYHSKHTGRDGVSYALDAQTFARLDASDDVSGLQPSAPRA
jgi:diguanylate cyclase (GGDEF)-like protein